MLERDGFPSWNPAAFGSAASTTNARKPRWGPNSVIAALVAMARRSTRGRSTVVFSS